MSRTKLTKVQGIVFDSLANAQYGWLLLPNRGDLRAARNLVDKGLAREFRHLLFELTAAGRREALRRKAEEELAHRRDCDTCEESPL